MDISLIDITSFQNSVTTWFLSNGRIYPWRRTSNPFHILLAELLLRLTGAWKAEKAYNTIISKYGNPYLMSKADLSELYEIFRPLGLHTRASTLISISKNIEDRFYGRVPSTYPDLRSIKGIGQYTANAILCLAFNHKLPLVDGSVSRLFSRHFNFNINKPAYANKELWEFASELLPSSNFREFNLGLLDIGAIHCRYPKPICSNCPLTHSCLYHNQSYNSCLNC